MPIPIVGAVVGVALRGFGKALAKRAAKKVSKTINSVKPAKNLKKKRADTEGVMKTRTDNKLTSDSSKKTVRDAVLKIKKINDKYKQ